MPMQNCCWNARTIQIQGSNVSLQAALWWGKGEIFKCSIHVSGKQWFPFEECQLRAYMPRYTTSTNTVNLNKILKLICCCLVICSSFSLSLDFVCGPFFWWILLNCIWPLLTLWSLIRDWIEKVGILASPNFCSIYQWIKQ